MEIADIALLRADLDAAIKGGAQLPALIVVLRWVIRAGVGAEGDTGGPVGEGTYGLV